MRSPGGYVPAIDGLRALAVIAVLLFHAGIPGASGGYLGVSVFFTISGFVITRSLVARAATRTGHAAPLALGQFYARRARRLLPASLATILACAVLGQAGVLPRVTDSELRWTTLNAGNWYQWRNGSDYAAVFAGQAGHLDPLVHFWSLAIEEQFYLAWPLVMLVVLRLPMRWATWTLGVLAGGLATLAMSTGPGAGPSTAYYHTLFRVPEILVGCFLALIVGRMRSGPRLAAATGVLGVVALAGLVAAVVLTGAGSDAWPYRGLLPLLAVVSAVVIAATCVPGPVTRLLARRPFVEVGRISYGVYLYHWPIFVVLFGRGWSSWAVAGAGIPMTLALAAASFHLAELPISRARVAVRPTLLSALGSVLVVLAAATLTTGRAAPAVALPELDPDVLAAVDFAPVSTPPPATGAPDGTTTNTSTPSATAVSTTTTASTSGSTSSSTSTSIPPPPLRVLVVGDSTAESLSVGLTNWALDHPDVQVSVAAFGACGLVRGGEYALGMLDAALQVECAERHNRTIPDALPHADVVVVLVTLADIWERSWDGGATWHGPADDEFRARLTRDYTAFADSVAAAGVPTLLWLRPPASSYTADEGPPRPEASFSDGSQAWIESVVAGLAAARPGAVAIGDLRGWFEASPLADDPAARPDGTHFSAGASASITTEWLVPQLAALPRRQ